MSLEVILNEEERARSMSDYAKFRGKCKELAEAAIAEDPTLRLERGNYICPFWGDQPHWWTVRKDGSIYDPTKDQFPSKGFGVYVSFDGQVECAQCGKSMKEEEASYYGNYSFCSTACICRFVGV